MGVSPSMSRPTPIWRRCLLIAERGQTEVIQVLLDAGARVDAGSTEGETPPHVAAYHSRHAAAIKLLESGADANAADGHGLPPLFRAIESCTPETVDLLLEHGADIQARSSMGLTPVHWACARERRRGFLVRPEQRHLPWDLRSWLQQGADVNARDQHGRTPLHGAAEKGAHLAISWLAQSGADVGAKDNAGWTALWCAALQRLMTLNSLRALVQAGADVNSTDEHDKTVLHHLAAPKHSAARTPLIGRSRRCWTTVRTPPPPMRTAIPLSTVPQHATAP